MEAALPLAATAIGRLLTSVEICMCCRLAWMTSSIPGSSETGWRQDAGCSRIAAYQPAGGVHHSPLSWSLLCSTEQADQGPSLRRRAALCTGCLPSQRPAMWRAALGLQPLTNRHRQGFEELCQQVEQCELLTDLLVRCTRAPDLL